MTERDPVVQWHSVMVEVAGGGIATQANGTPADPAILLIGGATRSGRSWSQRSPELRK